MYWYCSSYNRGGVELSGGCGLKNTGEVGHVVSTWVEVGDGNVKSVKSVSLPTDW